MEEVKEPNVSDFKNFANLSYREKLNLCYIENNLDSLIILQDENIVSSIIGRTLSNSSEIEISGKNILFMHPNGMEEEKAFFDFFEEEEIIRGGKYRAYGVDDRVLEFNDLRNNWMIRYKDAIIKEDYLTEEIKQIKDRLDLSNKHEVPFKSFFDLGANQSKLGKLNELYFWNIYFENYDTNKKFSSFHTLVSCARIYFSGYYFYQYYAFLKTFDPLDYFNYPKIFEKFKNESAKEIFEYFKEEFKRENPRMREAEIAGQIKILEEFIEKAEEINIITAKEKNRIGHLLNNDNEHIYSRLKNGHYQDNEIVNVTGSKEAFIYGKYFLFYDWLKEQVPKNIIKSANKKLKGATAKVMLQIIKELGLEPIRILNSNDEHFQKISELIFEKFGYRFNYRTLENNDNKINGYNTNVYSILSHFGYKTEANLYKATNNKRD